MNQHGKTGGGDGLCTGSKAERLLAAELVQISKPGTKPARRIEAASDGRGDAAAAAADDEADATADGGDSSRRDFLSLLGFSLGAAGLQACRAPVQHAIPLPAASPEMVPGVALTYATTCGACPSSCSLLVKQRDGRPIKIDGNPDSRLFGGGTCATGQASVLSLYDGTRPRGPTWLGHATTWATVDQHITEGLARLPPEQQVVLLSGTITSPSTRAAIAGWGQRHRNFAHVSYDAVSASALRQASERMFGRRVVPHYAFDQARVVLAFEADFLGTWLSPVEFARGYALTRRPPAPPSLHVQVESGYSVTGSNADLRVPVAPSELAAVAAAVFDRLVERAGIASALVGQWSAPPPSPAPGSRLAGLVSTSTLDTIVDRLWAARGASLVVSGSDDVDLQTVVAAMNVLLLNVGATVDVKRASLQRQGDDHALAALTARIAAGQVGALLIHGANPVFDHPDGRAFAAALQRVPLTISLSDRLDETSARVHAVCPDHHFLESWGDAEPVEGHFSLAQPLIAPLFDTRAATESLLRWSGESSINHRDHVRAHWRRALFPRQYQETSFEAFWDQTLQQGVVELPNPPLPDGEGRPKKAGLLEAARLATAFRQAFVDNPGPPLELHLFESVALRDGRHANNPWLQELPDPITRTTWGNVAAVAPALATRLGLTSGDVVILSTGDRAVELPIFVQSGQPARSVSVAVGYGRTMAGPAGDSVGANSYQLGRLGVNGRSGGGPITLTPTGRRVLLPSAQTHLSMEGRPIAQTIADDELRGHHQQAPAEAPAEAKTETEAETAAPPTLWKPRLQGEHSWGMAIDLDACTGCSACVVACQVENNVPVVGKDQVQRNRIMHWLRIDRYFDDDQQGDVTSLHQPMMCQHCGNAPCETVCPVLATTTSSDGLNQQVYNRCIGTRYCANNCPYKVRRFNWLEYTKAGPHASHMEDPLGRLVLNPDVTIRTRGVMEKCSLCVQRIQLAKNHALQGHDQLHDGDIVTACQQSCPTGAIVFGDRRDPDSRVSHLLRGPRAFEVLEELGTRPNVGYLKRIRRSAKAEG